MIDSAKLLDLHRQLLAGSRTASEEIAAMLLAPLTRELRHDFPNFDPASVCDGVTDAILDYSANPTSFHSQRGIRLDRFLRKNAWRNVANILRGEKRRRQREQTAAEMAPVVELHPAAGNLLQDEIAKRQRKQQQALDSLYSPIDKRVQELRQGGERRTEEFAKVLGISHLSAADKRREVKKAKDRIDKIICRKKGVSE